LSPSPDKAFRRRGGRETKRGLPLLNTPLLMRGSILLTPHERENRIRNETRDKPSLEGDGVI
jgi:hypothetical protein